MALPHCLPLSSVHHVQNHDGACCQQDNMQPQPSDVQSKLVPTNLFSLTSLHNHGAFYLLSSQAPKWLPQACGPKEIHRQAPFSTCHTMHTSPFALFHAFPSGWNAQFYLFHLQVQMKAVSTVKFFSGVMENLCGLLCTTLSQSAL